MALMVNRHTCSPTHCREFLFLDITVAFTFVLPRVYLTTPLLQIGRSTDVSLHALLLSGAPPYWPPFSVTYRSLLIHSLSLATQTFYRHLAANLWFNGLPVTPLEPWSSANLLAKAFGVAKNFCPCRLAKMFLVPVQLFSALLRL